MVWEPGGLDDQTTRRPDYSSFVPQASAGAFRWRVIYTDYDDSARSMNSHCPIGPTWNRKFSSCTGCRPINSVGAALRGGPRGFTAAERHGPPDHPDCSPDGARRCPRSLHQHFARGGNAMNRKRAYGLAACLVWPLCLGCATDAAGLPGLAGKTGSREGYVAMNQVAASATRLARSDVVRGQTPADDTMMSAAFRQTPLPPGRDAALRQAAYRMAILPSHHRHAAAGCSTCGGGGCSHCSGGHEDGWYPTHYVWFDYVEPKNLVYPPTNQPAAVIQYPYYTVKGPTDFFLQ